MNTSSSKPQVSIGMPVYNTDEKFLYTALDCLLKQSYSNFELIISDDCSTDSTSRICREYAKKDSRINYIRQEKNMGALPNFNFGILLVEELSVVKLSLKKALSMLAMVLVKNSP